MKLNLTIGLLMCLLCTSGSAADFDGDGVADEFTITRDSAKAAKTPGVRLANPWEEVSPDRQPAKGLGFIIRLSREARTYLVNDASFFNGLMWLEEKPEKCMDIITRKDRRYRDWKKQVPALKADAIQVCTEPGIDILLYWNGKQWALFWPDEEP